VIRCVFVTADTAIRQTPSILAFAQNQGDSMSHEKDLAPLIELLKMAAERWPSSVIGAISESELFRRDRTLLELWPEACRRTGVGVHEFPPGVIKRWQQEMGQAN